jgi:hypothetical protein
MPFCDGRAERRQVCLAQIAFSDRSIESVPFGLGTTGFERMVDSSKNAFKYRIVALQPLNELDPSRLVR